MVQGNDLCDVMLDAVWQAGHAAAVHAGKSKCMHCAHFTNKFNSEMKDIMQQNGNGNRSTSSGKGTTRSHNKHPRRVSFQITHWIWHSILFNARLITYFGNFVFVPKWDETPSSK